MSRKVYYLDDEPVLCENFSDSFSNDDIIVTTFTDVATAIQKIIKDPPDLLFLDYRLPGTTGDEVALLLDPKIKKYLITGDINIQTKYHFLKVFTKPYKTNEIAEIFHDLIVHAS